MANRKKVFVQIKDRFNNRWYNYKAAETYEDAIKLLGKLECKYPYAIMRVLDNNLVTHTNSNNINEPARQIPGRKQESISQYIYSHGTYGEILYRKSAEELEKEVFESGAKVVLEWIEEGHKFKMLQIGMKELWRFEYLPDDKTPRYAFKAEMI